MFEFSDGVLVSCLLALNSAEVGIINTEFLFLGVSDEPRTGNETALTHSFIVMIYLSTNKHHQVVLL